MATNIYNTSTGQQGYQIPGATLPTGWQAIGSTAVTPPTTVSTPSATPVPTPNASVTSSIPSPEDQKLLAMGISPDQLKQLNTPEGLDPTSFQNLIGNVETKLKTNNDLVTQRGYLMKQLFDSPLTPDEKKALPEDIQRVVASGDKDTIQLQLRLMNDQIAGRANTLSQSIGYLADSYQTHVADLEKQKNDAIKNVIDFVDSYGSKAPQVLSSLYGPTYLDKLKAMGIDIAHMASISTLAQDKANASGGGSGTTGGTDLFTKTQLNKIANNAGLNVTLPEFLNLPYEVKNYLLNNYTAFSSDLSKVASGDLTVQEMRDNINGSPTLSQSVKDYLNGILDKKYPTKASSPSFLSQTGKVISDTASGAWSEIKSWFGQ